MFRFSKKYAFYLLSCIVLGVVASWIFAPLFITVPTVKLLAPLPAFLLRTSNTQVTTLDLWEPVRNLFAQANEPSLAISAKSALSYDITTDSPIFEFSPNTKLPMASLTKIMTAVVALEHPKQPGEYVVTQDALVGEDSMGLVVGEVLTRRDLLYGLILHSGNDAAEVLAANFPGGRDEFIRAMNGKASALGLSDTHFTNPTGLEGDGKQYTTAYDLLRITRFALETFPEFDEITSAVSYSIPQTPTHQAYDLENETNLLTSYPGVKGVKTGYTPEAGLCLVTYLEYGGHKIIGVVLGSEDRRDDMKEILDYSLKKFGITPPIHS